MVNAWRFDIRALDGGLILMVMALVILGLVMVLSSSVAVSEVRFGHQWHYFQRQVFALGLGGLLAALVIMVPSESWLRHRGKWFLLGLVLLALVLIFGREIGGAKRWLPLVVMNFQPAEWMKIATILFLAGYLQRHQDAVKQDASAVMRLFLPFGIMAGLLLLQPDYGTTVLIAGVLVGMLFIAGAPFRYFVITVLPIGALLAALVINSPYRMARVMNFMDPWQDPYGVGYQLSQALMAIGSGGLTGSGLGASVQKLLYLPDAHTDFMFAVFAEETGWLGVVLLLSLYGLLLWRMFAIAQAAWMPEAPFKALVVYGIAIMFAGQILINVGVNLGVFPTKGLTLPFVSYGGSSLMMALLAIGLVLRIEYETRLSRSMAIAAPVQQEANPQGVL
ncbi:cell division protein FtsW [Thiomicrospira aerophila AL3]|uniref:Probable peptidoglycan glycosyltransferase FtsW n=1 Tax=Thiomicrospira aerophila AL3 TaxID=717772 RepID=W0DY58_9GAMM|nr:putative lipid II flippase FtsW [Thiomicrospira aerophila]AHF01791.1 cell division protein FtsW [Thiomicrospira aerophila AL3]